MLGCAGWGVWCCLLVTDGVLVWGKPGVWRGECRVCKRGAENVMWGGLLGKTCRGEDFEGGIEKVEEQMESCAQVRDISQGVWRLRGSCVGGIGSLRRC